MTKELDIVDIHTHLWPPAWGPGGKYEKPAGAFSPEIYRKITTPSALIDEFEAAGISLAVITATIESLFGAEGPVLFDRLREANDWLADLAADNAGLVAFGATDIFAGEDGAREAERAIVELGFSGLVVDSSRAGKFLAAPEARPTLEVAARYNVPIFVHPVAHPNSDILIEGAGLPGNSLGRGLMNGVAFLSVIQGDLLNELPDLHLVFATLGLGAIVQAARGGRYGRDNRVGTLPNIYFDTMGHDPAIIRTLVGFFGTEHVLAGTDWPILPALQRETLSASLAEAGLNEAEQRMVAGGNARHLLGLHTKAP